MTDRPLTGGRLLRRVLGAVALKLLFLILLYAVFFSPAHRPAQTAESVAAALLGH